MKDKLGNEVHVGDTVSTDATLCTEDKYKIYTVTMAINGKPSSAKIEIGAKSYNDAEDILFDLTIRRKYVLQ